MVLQGKLRAAVRMATNRDKGGGVYSPEDSDTKTGKRVIDVLRSKHPDLMIPRLEEEGWMSFEEYDECPSAIPLDCTQETVKEVAGKLQGGAGPSSVDAIAGKDWLLHHGRASQELREELAAWADWLGNEMPPWAAFRALMGCRLAALDKNPDRRCVAKCVLKECGEDAKAACGSTQLCAGLKAGIEGAIHSMTERVEDHNSLEFGEWEVDDEMQESLPERRAREALATRMQALEEQVEELGEGEELPPELAAALEETLFLVDTTNGFNLLSRLGMLWTVWHRCPKMAIFAFNCYRHEVRLVCRSGDPMAMALYGVALCPLAEHLRAEFPDVLQPWYADDAAMMASADKVARTMKELIRVGPMFGYHPEPDKSWAICPLGSEAKAKAAFEAEGLQSSAEASSVLVKSLLEGGALDGIEHKQCVRAAGTKARKERTEAEKAKVGEMAGEAGRAVTKRLERIGKTGAWLTVMPHKLHGTLLSAEEWRDNAQIRYGIRPSGLCDRCDGCSAPLSVEHGLGCKKGGLVGLRHNMMRDEAGQLAAMSLNPLRVSCKSYIFHGMAVVAGQVSQRRERNNGGEGEGSRGRKELSSTKPAATSLFLDSRRGGGCVLLDTKSRTRTGSPTHSPR
ncbi:hypothetical protein ACHAWF_002319 [Thalassiosira exigua]